MKLTRRLLSMLLALAMVFALLPMGVAAEETPAEPEPAATLPEETAAEEVEPDAVGAQIPVIGEALEIEPWVNPLYADVLDVEDLPAYEAPEKPDASVQATFVTPEAASKTLRSYMKSRTEDITLYVYSTSRDHNSILSDMLYAAMEHNGNPTEGDYLLWHLGGVAGGQAEREPYNNGYCYTFTITLFYYTSKEQEAEMDTAVDALLDQLDVRNRTDYEKAKAVYDYICENVTYDYDHLEDTSYYLQFSAYAALVNKTAVCQGYAQLFYRLMLELGVDCRVITGIGGDDVSGYGPHAWNIVAVDGLYYNVDSTWDAGYDEYWWFLNNAWNFVGHYRAADYETAEFHMAYPMAAEDYDPNVPGEVDPVMNYGYCGDNAIWIMSREGELVITGTGAMYDYGYLEEDLPDWTYLSASAITSVYVDEGITYIGDYAFGELPNLTEVTLPDGVESMGYGVFSHDAALISVRFPDSMTEIGTGTFFQCAALMEVVLPPNLEVLPERTFKECTSLAVVVMPDSLKRIGSEAFIDCSSLTEITLPNGLERIDEYAFQDAGLQRVVVPGSVTWIGRAAFARCPLTEAILENGITQTGGDMFENCTSLCDVTLPATLTVIGSGSFEGCTALDTIDLPNGLLTIGSNAFMGTSLTALVIPDTVTEIYSWAFRDCGYIKEVTIPASVVHLDGFSNCDGLEAVYLYNSGAVEAYAFNGCLVLSTVVIGDAVTSIGEKAFAGNPALTSIVIGEAVTTIGKQAFGSCNNLETVWFEGDVPDIAVDAFYRVTATAYYPLGNTTWTAEVMKGYGGTITWMTAPHEHEYEAVVTPPTCIDQGYTTYTCTLCADFYVDDYTDSLPGVSEHTPGEAVSENFVDATCTANGSYDDVTYCSVCGMELDRDTVKTDRLPHAYESVVTDSTCAEYGYTTHTCVECGYWYKDSYTDALPHTPGEAVTENIVNPTCSAKGSYDRVIYCTVCGHELERVTEEMELLPHAYESVVTPPTCTERGCTTHTCVECGDSYVDSYTDALGHNCTYSVTTIPTEFKPGALTGTCAVCGHGETVELPAISEADYEITVLQEPTDSEPGAAVCVWKNTEYGEIRFEAVLRPLAVIGDVNGDEEIDILDANLIVAWYNEVRELDDKQLAAADVNGDGEVDIMDANMIVAYYNEVIEEFPAAKK